MMYGYTLYKSNYEPIQTLIEINVLLLCLIVLIVIFYKQIPTETIENFAETTTTGKAKSVKSYGHTNTMANMANPATTRIRQGLSQKFAFTQPSIQRNQTISSDGVVTEEQTTLYKIDPKFFEEDISTFIKSLTLYYTIFDARSISGSTKVWKNISPYFSPTGSCTDVLLDHTHLTFQHTVTTDPYYGLIVGPNRIYGPKSFSMGIDVNASFSFFMCLKISETQPDCTIIKSFANTQNNNAFTFSIRKGTSSGFFKFIISIGNDYTSESQELEFKNLHEPVLIALSKRDMNVSIFTSQHNQVQLATIQTNENIYLSNKEIELVATNGLYGYVYNIGFYKRPFTDNDVKTIINHVKDEIYKRSEEYIKIQEKDLEYQLELKKIKQCNMAPEICEKCTEITDWSDFFTVLRTARDPCLKAVNDFCSVNTTATGCECWDPTGIEYGTSRCKAIRSFFSIREVVDWGVTDLGYLFELLSKNYAQDKICNMLKDYNMCQKCELNSPPDNTSTYKHNKHRVLSEDTDSEQFPRRYPKISVKDFEVEDNKQKKPELPENISNDFKNKYSLEDVLIKKTSAMKNTDNDTSKETKPLFKLDSSAYPANIPTESNHSHDTTKDTLQIPKNTEQMIGDMMKSANDMNKSVIDTIVKAKDINLPPDFGEEPKSSSSEGGFLGWLFGK